VNGVGGDKMVVPKRKSQMIKQMMNNIKVMKRELSKEEKERVKGKERPIDEGEHKKRMKLLKQIGVLK
jgi:hypothetical protein